MQKISLVVVLAILAFFIIQNKKNPHLLLNQPLDRILHPTDTRLRYRIADIDPRFNISQEKAIQLSQEAAKIWKDGTGKEFFLYDPKAKLTINFHYDQRQAESTARASSEKNIEANQAQWANKKQEVEAFREDIDRYNALLSAKKVEYDNQVQYYNEQIAQINQNGGANAAQREAFAQQKQYLSHQMDILKFEIEGYNQKINVLNQQVNELNQMNQNINLSIQHFNHRFKPYLFDKGNFDGRNINIFEFQSDDDLRLTLAHEFGHALGLKHHEDPKGLMHPMMKDQEQQNFRLLASDLALFKHRAY